MLNKEWDVDTVTVADYTVAMDITESMFFEYSKLYNQDKSKYGNFHEYLSKSLEAKLENDLPKVLTDYEDGHEKLEIQIATISFGYKNGSLLKALMERGGLIGNAKYKKLEPSDTKI